MSPRTSWKALKTKTFTRERAARIEAESKALAAELHLSQLRRARGLTQAALADLLGVQQAEVSRMERRSELYVGTLRKFIEAMNGELVLAARFADGTEIPIRLGDGESDEDRGR